MTIPGYDSEAWRDEVTEGCEDFYIKPGDVVVHCEYGAATVEAVWIAPPHDLNTTLMLPYWPWMDKDMIGVFLGPCERDGQKHWAPGEKISLPEPAEAQVASPAQEAAE